MQHKDFKNFEIFRFIMGRELSKDKARWSRELDKKKFIYADKLNKTTFSSERHWQWPQITTNNAYAVATHADNNLTATEHPSNNRRPIHTIS